MFLLQNVGLGKGDSEIIQQNMIEHIIEHQYSVMDAERAYPVGWKGGASQKI